LKDLVAASFRSRVVLVSKWLDDYLRNDVVSSGGYEVLPKPLAEPEDNPAGHQASDRCGTQLVRRSEAARSGTVGVRS
jgi:hypothetical protein